MLSSSKNSEAPATCNSQGLLSNKSGKGNIDMNIVQNNSLTFHNVAFTPVIHDKKTWFTSAELASALQYANIRAVSGIYNRHKDEFTDSMSLVLKMNTKGFGGGNSEKDVRVFSLRGAHLIAMMSNTPVAKEFRRWVLDLIDREVDNGNAPEPLEHLYTMHLTNSEMCSMAWLYKSAMHMREELEVLAPKLQALQSPLAYSANSMVINYKRDLENVRKIMAREVQQIHPDDVANNPNWERVLPDLKIH